MISNAGVSLGHHGLLPDIDSFSNLMQINLHASHTITAKVVPVMQKQKSGKLVFISSLASYVTMPTSVAYSTSKRALNAYVEGVRNLVAKDGIDVINILPGFIDTEMTQKNRFKMPFFLDIETGTKKIYNAIERRKKEYAFPFVFFVMVRTISFLPLFLRDRIIRYLNVDKG